MSERGPKGDHGQHGDQGERGERGENAVLPHRLGLWIALAVMALTVALFMLPHAAARNIRDTQVEACEAAKIDRGLQAESWRAAHKARMSTARATDDPNEREVALAAAKVYAETANRLEARSDERYVCSDQYPEPSLLPF